MVYSVIGNWVGWYYIPNLATRYSLNLFHHVLANYLHIKPPQPGTLEYQRHYRYTYAVVVTGYLLYNLVEGSRSMPANFYEVLRVPPDVDENGLKMAFRQFARYNHPDRPGIGPEGQAAFIAVRDMYEALKNPVVRFAYDRFGPDVVTWQNLATPREYLRRGLLQSSGYHIAMGLVLVCVSSIGKPSPVKFWRYMLYIALLTMELSFILSSSLMSYDSAYTSSSHRSIFNVVFPNRVSFQHILFLHQLFMFLSTGLTQVAPVLFPTLPPHAETDALLQRLTFMAGTADKEASITLHTGLHSIQPFQADSRTSVALMRPCDKPSPEVMQQLAAGFERLIIEKNIMQEGGPLRSAWENAIKRGRIEKAATYLNPSDASDSLPSPISPRATPIPEVNLPKVESFPVRLPSPRPSPPPRLGRKGSGRARSLSY